MKLYSIRDICGIIKTSDKYVRDRIAAGDLEAHRISSVWVITEDALERFLESRKVS